MYVRYILIFSLFSFIFMPTYALSAEPSKDLPDTLQQISEKNTAKTPLIAEEKIEPNDQVKQMIKDIKHPVKNDSLIQLLNETSIQTGPIPFGHKSNIYLGRWPLHYISQSSKIVPDYHLINQNELQNQQSDKRKLTYLQYEEAEVKGALQHKTKDAAAVKSLIAVEAQKQWKLPVGFTVTVGESTALAKPYDVPKNRTGKLSAYIPAVYEQGDVVYGDVYIAITGSQTKVQLKNITKQKMSAWVPIANYVTLTFETKEVVQDE